MTRGDWLTGKSTSIGADNGAAIALGMVLVTDPAVKHPPLELLFTVDEETGLNGAKKLPADFIRGRILLNVDSEDEGIFTIGCAGGIDTLMTRDVELAELPDDHILVDISAGGMRGGHSGIDIGKHRANANKVLARVLAAAGKVADLRLVTLAGGTKHNAIPREARATVALPADTFAEVEKAVAALAADMVAEFQATEKTLSVAVAKSAGETGKPALSPGDTQTIMAWLMITPNGVMERIPGDAGRVETSCNTAVMGLEANRFSLLVSQRSAVMSRLRALNAQVMAGAALAGADARTTNQYPNWPVHADAPLLNRCRQVYQTCFGKEPVVEVIHAGLECAVIGSKYPGMEMISFGPTMKNPHSPDEKVRIPSGAEFYTVLTRTLEKLA